MSQAPSEAREPVADGGDAARHAAAASYEPHSGGGYAYSDPEESFHAAERPGQAMAGSGIPPEFSAAPAEPGAAAATSHGHAPAHPSLMAVPAPAPAQAEPEYVVVSDPVFPRGWKSDYTTPVSHNFVIPRLPHL